ncbi:hypothetical protein E2562_000736 [Oryza meyeriana var. granulata]|uniref:Uncharacterized protein n=1 Tax=Oryza meyeriana var. granulata TaxID=110450 RepID=A0A6G1DUN5_9ORYZ|nr:hypothetical protein E2562_000736 [Oryza meyeriana var. granulata]
MARSQMKRRWQEEVAAKGDTRSASRWRRWEEIGAAEGMRIGDARGHHKSGVCLGEEIGRSPSAAESLPNPPNPPGSYSRIQIGGVRVSVFPMAAARGARSRVSAAAFVAVVLVAGLATGGTAAEIRRQ